MLRSRHCLAAVGCLVLNACGSGSTELGRDAEAVIDGSDGRVEYFDLDAATADLLAHSSAALIENRRLDRTHGRLAAETPTLAQSTGLCADEPFSTQPDAAFCSGVLVDADLVLTAGHCVRAFALSDFSIVLGYYYAAPDALALTASGIFTPAAIVAEALDDATADPRYDYAWLRLSRPVGDEFAPLPLYRLPPPLAAGEPLVTIGSPEGIPLKADTSATVADPRGGIDYFTAHTDTSSGWSGGGAFDPGLALVGILSRGGPDLGESPDGCQRELVESAEQAAGEQFTYAYAALQALCAQEPSRSLCRSDCDEPCSALPTAPAPASSVKTSPSCAISPRLTASPSTPSLLLVALGALHARRRRGPRRVRGRRSSQYDEG